MKKRILCTLCCALMLTGLVGCNNSEPDQPQQNATTTPRVRSTIDYNDIETDIDLNDDADAIPNKKRTTEEKNLASEYKEIVENMNKAKNYHSEITYYVKTYKDSNNTTELAVELKGQISSDYFLKGEDGEEQHEIIHSKSKEIKTHIPTGISLKNEYESYGKKVHLSYTNFYNYYEKSSKSEWKNKTKGETVFSFTQLYPRGIRNIEVNEEESTPEIKVFEGTTYAALNGNTMDDDEIDQSSQNDTKFKVRVDVKNKLILSSEIHENVEKMKSDGTKSSYAGTIIQKFSKINKNIDVQIPDSVISAAQ